MRRFYSIFLFLMIAVANVVALDWQAQRIEQRVFASVPVVEVEYPFTNNSTSTVTIEDVKTSCGCTVSELGQSVYAPGESGKIKASFKTARKVGRNFVSISVKTDAATEPERLTLAVEVVEQMRFPRKLLLWKRQDGPISHRYLDINFEGTGEILELTATSADERFAAAIEPTEDPLHWKLKVTPDVALLPDGRVRSRVTVKAKTKEAGELSAVIFVQVL